MVTTFITILNWIVTIVTAYIVISKSKKAYASALEIYKKTNSQQVLTSVPGVCTAWGIFFTFVSIVLCLLILCLVGDGSDFSIFNITGSIVPAFVTSVLGMWFSIKYSEEVKKIIAEEERKESVNYGNPAEQIAKIAEASEHVEMFLTRDMYDQMRRYDDMQRKANAELHSAFDKLAKDFSTAIQSSNTPILDKLTEHTQVFDLMSGQLVVIKQKIESQNDSLQKFVNSFTSEFNKFFTSAHSSFEQQMKDYTTIEVKKYTDTLTEVGKQMKEISESILNTQKSSVETIGNKVIEQLENSNTEVSNKLKQHTTDTENKLNESTASITETLNSVVTSIQELTNQCKELVTTLQNQQREATKTAMETQKATLDACTANVKESLLENTKNISETLSTSIADMVSKLSITSETINKQMEDMHKSHSEAIIQTVTAQQTAIDNSTKIVTENLTDYAKTITESMQSSQQTVSSTMQKSATDAVTAINGLVNDIKEKFEDLSSKITDASLKPLETLQTETEFISERVGQICSRYQQAQEAYSNTLQNVHMNNENWEKSINANSESLAHIETVSTAVSELLDVLKSKNEAMKEVQDEIRGITETISQLQELNSVLTKILAK